MIALIAGQGALPGVVRAALEAQGQTVDVYALEGYPPDDLTAEPFRIEQLGTLLNSLAERGANKVCFAGSVARPKIDPSKIDAATMPLVPRMMQALHVGDDAALRIVLDFFQEAGMTPVAAHDLCPDLLPPEGPMVGEMSERDQKDLARAQTVHAGLGALDIGQSVVVTGGQVLAVEALPGTDWMLRSIAAPLEQGGAKFSYENFVRPEGGVLYKGPKPGQDRRIDLPVIGPQTVQLAAQAGLRGIVIEAQGVMVLDQETTAQIARDAGLFLCVLGRDT